MKSDFRTSSRGWLRPLLCWAPSTLLLLTITTLLLNAEYSSAVISEHTTVDNNWIKLDENFPPRHDAAGHPYSRFYYARGKITDRLRLRNETIAEITGKDITMFHVQFDIWRNNLKGKCAKQVTLSKGLTERPERLNTLSDGYWNHVSEQYTEEQFKKFELWLYAQEDCDNSLLAIKDLTVTYNSYIRLEDKKKQPGETFIQLTPDDLELSATGKEKHQYFLQDKLCHKQEGCTLKIKLDSNANLKVYFWSTVEGDEIKAGTQSHKTPNQPETKFAFVELKNADMKKTTDNKYELTIQVVTAAENSLAIVQIGDEKLTTGFTIEPTGKVGDWEPVNPSLFNDFLNSHKGKAQLLAHKTDNATAKIGAEGTATVLADVCYKVTYFAETGAGQRKFTISADSVPVSNEDLVQSYPLVEFTPISGIKQPFEFCITDYIFDLKAVFKSGNVQLHLTTEANPSTDKANLSRKTAVVLEPTPKPKPADGGLHFIRETMKVDKVYESHLKWDSIVPGLLDDIKEDNNNPTNVITIKPDTSTNQTKQLFSKWLVNDIANINARPVVVELTLSGATTDELKNNNDFTVTATICDEIMECINTRKVETVNPLIQKKITYEFEFDAHPNAKSGHIKLRLAVGLPKGITAVVDLKSFGDPCFKGFKNVKSNDRCGINEKCDDKKNPKLSLANSGACTCNDNFIQNATGTCVEDQCNRPQTPENDCDKATLDCQNTPDGKSFECVCPASTTELQIWTTNKKCEKLLDPTQFKDNSVWIMPVGKVNPAIYDICYKFTPTVNPEPTAAKPLAFTFSLEYTYTDENGISKKVSLLSEEMFKLTAKAGPLVDLCLSQLMDGYVTKNAVLTATVKVQSQDKIEFAVDNSVLYSKEAPKQSLQNEHTKMISKSLSIPFGYLTPASTLIPPDNEKQTINIMHTDYHKNDKMTVYSEWITIPEIMRTDSSNNLNLNIIKPEVSGSVIAVNSIQLCKPRNIGSNAPYCAAYTEGNFVETLAMLEPTNSKFQIVYSLIVQDEIKAIDVPKTTFTSTVSLFNACQTQKPECKSNGKCAPREFTFQCEGGNCGSAKGKLCDELECPPANKKICDVQHSDCVQFENRFQCRCPLGFESDETNQVCHRKGVQSNTKRCSPDSPGECPFTNITTNEHFSRLPSNFPRIDATNPGQRKEELYYAFRRASKLTVALQDKDKNEWVGQPNADVCIKFRYFVSKESTLTLHLIEPDNQAAPDLELVNLPSAFYDPEKNDATTTDATKTLSISPETEVCIKALLPLGKLQTLEKFNLVFVADVQSQDGAVIVELLPYNAGSLLIQVHKNREEVPNKALRYLSQATVELDEKKADGKTVQSDFRYQWPVLVPENTNLDNRWKVETTLISPLVGSIAFKKGAIDGTKESVLIESAWIDRLLGRSTPAAAVNFYFKLDLPIAFKSTADFNMEIVLLNANRQPILANGNQPSIAPALNMDNILEKGMVENAQRKSKTFFLRLDQYEVPFGQKFKVQFRITFRNIKEFTGESFRISDLSFGDPCVEHKQKEGTDPEAAIKMRCQGVINDERKENKNAKCNRLPHPTAGTVDFQCECNDKALSGKKCELADNCKLKHKISAKNPDRQQDVPKVSTTTGEEYCKKINTKNECRNVEIGDKDFACLCENKKQKFNFFTQDCTDIDDCVFNPCDFATELCSINKDTKHRQCDCRPGYKRVNVNDTSCTPLSWEEAQCPIEECSSTDPNMRCLSGEKDVHRCTCRKGFVMKRLPGSTDRWHCESEMCSFQGLHSCEQGCESTQTPPYYQCKCGGDYEPVENHQTNVTECHLKATSACKNWSGRYKTCIGGVPGCVSGYELSADGTACQPKATFKLEPACPSGAYRFDEAAKEYVCDCSNATLTRGYFTADADMPATCKLTATVCDAGQPGRNVCSRLGAGCLLDPDSLTAYSCACHLGRLFPDGRRVLTSAELAKLPLPTGAVACLDVCELPYRRSQCAAIGAQCNSRKLWTALHGGQANIKAVDFCDCVSGTFAQTDDPLLPDTTTSCVQEGKALTLTLTIQWTADMQAELNKKMEAFLRGKVTTAQIMDQPTALQRHDPEGFARAEFRVIRANRAEASALTAAAAWQEEIRATVLAHQAATLLADFKLANKPGDLKGPETIVGTDVQVVQVQEAKIDGRLLAYTVQLAVRMPDRVRKAEAELQQLYLDYLNAEEGEQPEADAAATTTAAAATTTAAATTPATHLDQSLPKSVDLFNEVMAACVALEAESCIISYLPIILRKAAKLEPALHQPCTTGGAGGLPACNGMSNCRPLNGSTFECLCGEGFDVEMSYTFKSAENKGLVVHKNEYCKAQDLCTSNCLDGDKTHTRCLHKAPTRDSATSHWVNSYSCDCVDKYVPQGANNGTCTYVCATLNCGGGDHGECVPAAKSASCRCKEGFYGEHCQHTVGSNTWWIVGIVVLGVLALAAIGAAVFFWRKS